MSICIEPGCTRETMPSFPGKRAPVRCVIHREEHRMSIRREQERRRYERKCAKRLEERQTQAQCWCCHIPLPGAAHDNRICADCARNYKQAREREMHYPRVRIVDPEQDGIKRKGPPPTGIAIFNPYWSAPGGDD